MARGTAPSIPRLRSDLRTYLAGRPARPIHLGYASDHIPWVNRRYKLHAIDGNRTHLTFHKPTRHHASRFINKSQYGATVYVAIEIQIECISDPAQAHNGFGS
jgi:hypothetical protein